MKTSATASALILLAIGADAYPKGGSTVNGGTVVDATYNFKNDQFGANDNLNLGVSVQQNSAPAPAPASKPAPAPASKPAPKTAPKSNKKTAKRGIHQNIYIRDADGSYIIERNAYPEAFPKNKGSTVSGGNQVTNSYNLNSDAFGSNSNFNMQSTTAINGGNTGAAIVSGGSKRKSGKRSLEARFLNGGTAKGGDSTTKGGNSSNNRNSISKTNLQGNGQIINMSSATSQKGGNTMGGTGGRNGGSGGAGGSFDISAQLPPIPVKRWLHTRNAEIEARSADIEARSAELVALIHEREAFLDGGGAKGGNSNANGGNESKNQNSISKTNLRGNGQIINMSSSTSQRGGNTRGGTGGANTGTGGAGGGMQLSAQLPPIPVRRGLEERDAEARAWAGFEEREAEPEYKEYYQLFTREADPEAYPEAYAEAEAEAEAYAYAEAEAEFDY